MTMERPAEFTAASRRRTTINGNEVTAHLASVLGQKLVSSGLDQQSAEGIALTVLDEVRNQYAGQNIYFPYGTKEIVAERDMEIYHRHARNELTIPQIAKEYGISIQWAYHILRTVPAKLRKEREAQRQAERDQEQARWKREN